MPRKKRGSQLTAHEVKGEVRGDAAVSSPERSTPDRCKGNPLLSRGTRRKDVSALTFGSEDTSKISPLLACGTEDIGSGGRAGGCLWPSFVHVFLSCLYTTAVHVYDICKYLTPDTKYERIVRANSAINTYR